MHREYLFYVYILSNFERTTFYIGFTNNLVKRVIDHKFNFGSVFTKKYKLKYLVYYEEYQYVDDAIAREKELKGWTRKKKIKLIKKVNPLMKDLSKELFDDYGISTEEIKELIKQLKQDKK